MQKASKIDPKTNQNRYQFRDRFLDGILSDFQTRFLSPEATSGGGLGQRCALTSFFETFPLQMQ